jgi:endonuclease/exonuclease/phosphatase family metal-dependent hydrolase
MRVATFNILHGCSPADDRVDPTRLRDAITSLDPDVLALQEVDRDQPRSGHHDLAAVAARAMRALDHRFVPAMHGTPESGWSPAARSSPPGAPAYGIALLTRYPVTAWKLLRLPLPRTPVPTRLEGDTMPTLVHEEQRVAVGAQLDTPDGPVTVVGTHLSFTRWSSGRQLRALAQALRDRTGVPGHPLLLLGDLNMGPRRAGRATGLTPLVDAPTFPAGTPRLQLDHVLADRPLAVTSSAAPHLAVSDHRALVVDVELSS